MSPAAPRVSVVVPAHGADARLALCLEGLGSQTFEDFETIVVGREGSEERRLSAGAARNAGAEIARGDPIVFLDADCRPDPKWLERLVAAHDGGRRVVGGAIAGGSFRRGAPRSPGGWFARGVHFCKFAFWVPGGPEGERDQLPTANLCLDRATWASVGPFAVEGWSEDCELSWRSRAAGRELHFAPLALVTHYHRSGPRDFWRERVERGRSFAEVRRRFFAWPRARVWAQLALFPLVAPAMTGRALAHAHRAGRLREALWLSPLVLAGYFGWSVGEAMENARMIRAPERR